MRTLGAHFHILTKVRISMYTNIQNLWKRTVAGALSAVMGLTAVLSGASLSASAEELSSISGRSAAPVKAEIEPDSSFGALLMNAADEQGDETDTSPDYSILDVNVEDAISVSYYADKDCTVVVGFYSEDGSELPPCTCFKSRSCSQNSHTSGVPRHSAAVSSALPQNGTSPSSMMSSEDEVVSFRKNSQRK